ncbi:MAG: MarR family transcriptional regulator [Spirochaetes bacterium]|nr:MarR family transcriptional regulator [Spirochaetota bacterium]
MSDLDRAAHEFGTGILLQHAEMYLIEIIGAHEGTSMTGIADIMQITKGAVSQTFKKLERKGLVKKYTDPENATRVLLHLSADGKKVLQMHEKWHKEKDGGFTEFLQGLEQDDVSVIKNFLTRYEFFLDKRKE